MSKGKHIDYDKWLNSNLELLNITVLNTNKEEVKFMCNVCGCTRTLKLKSLYKRGGEVHSEQCSKIINRKIEQEIGKDNLYVYRSLYRRSKERCCNPNSKDYNTYKGKFNFKDFCHFYSETYHLFVQSLNEFPNETLSIDRIDNTLGYEPNNIRFVPMRINLQNKDCVRPIMCVNVITSEVLKFPSANSVAKNLLGNANKTSSVLRAIKNDSLYKNTWKFFYLK